MTPLVLIASLLAAPAQQPDPETRWYGAQTLLSDAAAVGLGFAAAHAENRGSAALFAASTAFYFVGAPIVHFVHGRGDAGGNSLGMRLWIPLGLGLAGAGVGALAHCQPSTGGEPGLRGLDDCVVLGAIAGVAAGALTASLIDALILAREPVAEPRIAPQVGWMRDRSGDLTRPSGSRRGSESLPAGARGDAGSSTRRRRHTLIQSKPPASRLKSPT